MATHLIRQEDFHKQVPSSVQLDPKWFFEPNIQYVENEYIVCMIGQDLYDELITQIETDTLTVDNATLLDTYLKPCVSWYLIAESMVLSTYRIENKGLMQNIDDTSQAASGSQLRFTQDYCKNRAQRLADMTLKYLEKNKDLYPLWNLDCGQACNPFTGYLIMPNAYKRDRFRY